MAAVVVLALMGAGVLLWQQPWRPSASPEAPGYPEDAVRLLEGQLRAMSGAAGDDLVVAAGGGETARTAAVALQRLGATVTELGYVDGGQAATDADGTTAVTANVAWHTDGSVLPEAQHESVVELRWRPHGDGFRWVGTSHRSGEPLPVWMAGDVTVDVREATTVVGVEGADPAPFADLASAAADHVTGALGDTAAERLAVVLPPTDAGLARLAGRSVDEVAGIAAVTTRLDATEDAGAVVALNPAVFAEMDERGRRIVMAHEAVHQLTQVVGSRVEMWLAEGFADAIALASDEADLEVSAGRILAEVRRDGPPARLPTPQDFSDAGRATAVYESAWLAVRLLIERYGAAEVRALYDAVVAGTDIETALRETLATDLATVTDEWRAYLVALAS